MNEPDRTAIADTPQASCDLDALLASLCAEGAGRFDPVRLHYLEALAKRTAAQQGTVKRLLDARLVQVLTSFKERFELARRNAAEAIERTPQHDPRAAKDLQQLYTAGDFKELQRLIATANANEQDASLSALVRRLEQHTAENTIARVETSVGSRPELKALRNFRNTWSKLSVDRQVSQAIGQAPKNAGPINSHMLVLRSLALMRDVSPDYLNRFMSYAETLLWLDQGEKEKPVAVKKQQGARAVKK